MIPRITFNTISFAYAPVGAKATSAIEKLLTNAQ